MATTEELQSRLDEAEQAYHDLCIGKGVVRLRDSNNEEVQYNITALPRLAAYIADLKRQLGQSPCSGPMRPLFT